MTDQTEQEVGKLVNSFLGRELYVYFSTPAAPREEISKKIKDHLAYQVKLETEGTLFAAGPMFEEGAETPVRGMIVVRAANFDEAKAIADADPLHAAGLRTYTLDRWKVNEGSYTVTVKYSDQSASFS